MVLALISLVGSLSVSAGIGITIIVLGDFGDNEIRILATSGSLAGFTILCMPSLFHMERNRYIPFTILGVSTSLISFTLLVFVIWGGELIYGEAVAKLIISLGIIAFSTNHSLLILIATLRRRIVSVWQRVTVLVVGLVGFISLTAIWAEDMNEAVARIFGVLVVLGVLGTVTTPIIIRIFRSS